MKEPSQRFFYVASGVLITASLLVIASLYSPSSQQTEDPVSKLHWSYEAEQTDQNQMVDWSDYLVCSQGTLQSPIDIPSDDVVVPDESQEQEILEWKSSVHTLDLARLTEEYDDNVFEVRDKTKPLMTVNGTTFHLTEIEVHAPSENAINGQHFDLEVQFRHTAPGPKYMVISAFFVKGDSEPGIIDELNEIISSPPRMGTRAVQFSSILQTLNSTVRSRYFKFNGSLTSPPCTEDVLWYILRDPLPALFFDIDEIAQDLSRNNRPVQPLNGRIIEVYGYWPKNETPPAEETVVTRAVRPSQLHLVRTPAKYPSAIPQGRLASELAIFNEVEKLRKEQAALDAGREDSAMARPPAQASEQKKVEGILEDRVEGAIASEMTDLRKQIVHDVDKAVPVKAAPVTREQAPARAAVAMPSLPSPVVAPSSLSNVQVSEKLQEMEAEINALRQRIQSPRAAHAAATSASLAGQPLAAAAASQVSGAPKAMAEVTGKPAEMHSLADAFAKHPEPAAPLPKLPALPALPRSAAGEPPRPVASARKTKLLAVDRKQAAAGLEARLDKDEEDEARVLIALYDRRSGRPTANNL